MSGVYCEQYGDTIRNQVLEYFLVHNTHVSAGQMAKELKISRQKAYEEIKDLLKLKFIKKFKMFNNTQLFQLDKTNPRVQLLQKNFMDCLKLVVEEYEEKNDETLLEEQNRLLKELINGVNDLKRMKS